MIYVLDVGFQNDTKSQNIFKIYTPRCRLQHILSYLKLRHIFFDHCPGLCHGLGVGRREKRKPMTDVSQSLSIACRIAVWWQSRLYSHATPRESGLEFVWFVVEFVGQRNCVTLPNRESGLRNAKDFFVRLLSGPQGQVS